MAAQQLTSNAILCCPMCRSYLPKDYVVVGYGSQPGGVPLFPVLRCRRHGVEFADAFSDDQQSKMTSTALTATQPTSVDVANLSVCYGDDPAAISPRYFEFMDRVEAITGPAEGRLLHDVGCGLGNLVFEAKRRGWRVQGNEIVPGVREGLERSGIRCFIGSLSGLDIETSSCDVVTSFCVLPHHLAEPTPDMLAVARMLKPDGWFVLQFPDNGLFRRMGKLMYKVLGDSRLTRHVMANLYGPGGHQFAWTRNNLRQYLSLCGFTDVTFQSYSGTPGITLARFRSTPAWYRACAAAAVYGLKFGGDILGIPNHSIAFARKQ